MPVMPTYPGVYVEEIPSGVRTITGVATSITAFIGRAQRGPVNEAVTVNSYGDFERVFGGLWAESTLGYAVRDFYRNGGGRAVIVRLFNPTFATEAERQTEQDKARTEAKTAADTVAEEAADAASSSADPATAESVAEAARKAAKAVADDSASHPAAVLASNRIAQAAEDAAAVEDPTPKAQDVADAAAQAVDAAVDAAVGAMAPRTRARLSAKGLELEAAYEGAWGNKLRARIDHDTRETEPDEAADSLFNLTVRDDGTGQVELFRNVSVTPGHPRQVDKVLENESRLVRIAAGGLPASRPDKHADVSGADVWKDSEANSKVADDRKASDGLYLTQQSFTGTGLEAKKHGLYALEEVDLFNLLCVPPYKQPSDRSVTSGDIDADLIDDLSRYCAKRRAMLLIDPPTKWRTKAEATKGIEQEVGSASKNAAIFFPRLRQPNPERGGQLEEFVPCGAVAGVFARTDAQRGVWKAPAGLEATLVGVPELSVPLTDEENGELNPLGINCLRVMPPGTRVIWGARTRVGDDRYSSEWKYIPVRRLALFIEESLYRGTQWVVFEPNDEPLWAQIRLNVGAFMHNLFRQGAFQGRTPREAYLVKCDRETTTQNDINNGIVNILVGFAPLKPAEFVFIKLQQLAGQIEV